jgi:hypothetical protein
MSQFLIPLRGAASSPGFDCFGSSTQLVMMGGCFVLSLYLTNNLQAKKFSFQASLVW